MNFSRSAFFSIALLLFSLFTYGQQQYPKTLLWRISGNGLTQPSYLFGTMHLTDKRLFNFGDSVYRAIERSQGLAIEINPDEMCAAIVNSLFDEMQDGKPLEEVLGEKDFDKYKQALSKKFGKPADKITTRDVMKEKNMWMNDLLEKGEMPTIVDAYLYNIARRQGKWLGGIEDVADQFGLSESLVDKWDIENVLAGDQSAKGNAGGDDDIDKLIRLYLDQDLEAIEKMSVGSSAAERDMVLIKRNIKMARRIDSLMALRSMFLAIGAAHLPGDSGVIRLLQDRGFTVEPVHSSKKINASNYTFREVVLPWIDVTDEKGFYNVSMPANPATVKMYGVLEMKFLFDIFNMSAFCTMAMLSPDRGMTPDSILSHFAREMFGSGKVKPSKRLTLGEATGVEFMEKARGSNIRAQLFVHNHVVYVAMVSALKNERLTSADADKFFKSFSINKRKPVAANMYVFEDSVMGIRFNTPAKLEYSKSLFKEEKEGWYMHGFAGIDAASAAYVMLGSREVQPGYFINSDSIVFAEMRQYIAQQINNPKEEISSLQGRRVLKFSGRFTQRPGIYGKLLTTIRGNRSMVLMVLTDSAHFNSPSVNEVFDSFTFLGQRSVWKKHLSADSTFSATVPRFFGESENHGGGINTSSYDTVTSTTCFVYTDTLNKYYWVNDEADLWKEYVGADPVIYEKSVQNGQVKGKEFLVKVSLGGDRYQRIRLLVNGNVLYKLLVSGDKEVIESENVNRFFSSFALHTPLVAPAFLQSKATVLFNDLFGSDSAIALEAFEAARYAPFVEADLPLLHDALFKTALTVDEVTKADMIGDRISELNDPSSIAFIRKRYTTLVNEKAQLRSVALTTLAKMHSKESYACLAELSTQAPPVTMPGYYFNQALQDSLALTATIAPALLKLAGDTTLVGHIADILLLLRDSGYIKTADIASRQEDFMRATAAIVSGGRQTDEYVWGLVRVTELLAELKPPAFSALMPALLKVRNKYVRQRIVVALLKNKLAVPAQAISGLAADSELRADLYSELKELNRTEMFPGKYLTQQHFAESYIHAVAEDYEPSRIEFLSTKKAVLKGKTYLFYLFKVTYEEEGEVYLGISGAFDEAGKKMEPEEYMTEIFWNEPFDPKRIEGFFEQYIKAYEGEELVAPPGVEQ